MNGIYRETVRSFNNRIIGFIDTLPNGDKEVRDSYNRYLGKYDKHLNVTRDSMGRMLYKGDQSSMLFNDKSNRR